MFFVHAVPVLYLLLDADYFWDGHYAPERLGRFACSMVPFAKLGASVLSHMLFHSATAQCSDLPSGPAISAILLALKMSVALTAPILVLLSNCIFDQAEIVRLKNTFLKPYLDNGLKGGIKKSLKTIGIMGGSAVVFVTQLSLLKHLDTYPTNILHKMADDVFLLFIFVLWYAVVTELLFTTYCVVYIRPFKKPK
jgi:hypothetical protein